MCITNKQQQKPAYNFHLTRKGGNNNNNNSGCGSKDKGKK